MEAVRLQQLLDAFRRWRAEQLEHVRERQAAILRGEGRAPAAAPRGEVPEPLGDLLCASDRALLLRAAEVFGVPQRPGQRAGDVLPLLGAVRGFEVLLGEIAGRQRSRGGAAA